MNAVRSCQHRCYHGGLAFLRLLVQQALEIPAAVENSDYNHDRLFHRKGDRDAAAPGDRPQAGPQIVAHRAATGKIGQLADMFGDAIGKALRDIRRRGSSNIVVNGIELVTRFRREDNGMGHAQPRWDARWWRSVSPARTSSSGMPREGSAS